MDFALQVYQLTAGEPKAPENLKTHTASSKKDFRELLENMESITKKPLNDETKEKDTDALLIQLLSLFNIDIVPRDLETLLPKELQNLLMDLGTIDLDVKLTADELNTCWQAIIKEFNITGNIKEDTIEKFYIALRKALADETDMDMDSLKDMIYKVLETKNLITHSSDGLETQSDIDLQVKNSMVVEAKRQNLSENVIKETSDTRRFKLETKTDDLAKDEALQIKVELKNVEEVSAAVDKLQNHAQLPIEPNNLQQNNILSFNTQTALVTSMDNSDSSVVTAPTYTYDMQDIFEQLTDKVQFALKGDVQEVRVRLKPDYLGDVLIKVISDRGKLKAELFVANSQIRSMLKAQTLDFQNQIRQQGYNFSEINVYEMSENGLEMGAFNHQSSSNNQYEAKKPKAYFYRHQDENFVAATDNFSLWEATSNVNLMA
ncbi:MAG TPA: hypothetical protein GX514_03585 [Thermoanaerobacterales bacterium]|nr:hypothetical protein [Thermoanaerobacterales bacterium]